MNTYALPGLAILGLAGGISTSAASIANDTENPALLIVASLLSLLCLFVLLRYSRKVGLSVLLATLLSAYILVVEEVVLPPDQRSWPIWLVIVSWVFALGILTSPWTLFYREDRTEKIQLTLGIVAAFIGIWSVLIPALGGM